jgi:hypothetical protein
MNYKKSFFVLSVLLSATINVHAQFDVKLHITDGITNIGVRTAIEKNTSLLLSEIGRAFVEERDPNFAAIAISPEAQKSILDTWHNTPFNCSRSELNRKIIKRYDGGYQVREIPVTIFDDSVALDDRMLNYVVNYNASGKIEDFYVTSHSISAMISEGMEVKEYVRRERIVDFIDQFRTAYNTKDLNFLNMVYGDSALIIIGKVVKIQPIKDSPVQIPTRQIDYTTQTKVQYLRKMKFVFAANKYINLDFKELEIQQHPKYPEMYGVVFKQHWNTSTYKDVGYVFLMIDFADENNPIIHIRTWQPERYNSGQELSKDEIFSVTSFIINR